MMPEKFFLHAERVGFERGRLRPPCAGPVGFAGLHQSFDVGEIFAGGLGVAGKRGAESRFGESRRGRTDGGCLQRNLPAGRRLRRHLRTL